MSSSQAQSQSEQIEAEIRQLQRLVELNPQQLRMRWLKNVENTAYRVELSLFTESYVEGEHKKVQLSHQHHIQIDVPPQYPNKPGHWVRITSLKLFHPNVPASGTWQGQYKLLDTVFTLWELFTFQRVDMQHNIKSDVARFWFERHPVQFPLTEIRLRQPTGGLGEFVVKRRVSSPGTGEMKSLSVRQHSVRPSPETIPEEKRGERSPSGNLVADQHVIKVTDRPQAQPSPQNEPEAMSLTPQPSTEASASGSGFRSKGIRVYQPQHWNFPHASWDQGNKQSYGTHWKYNVPREGYRHSNLRAVFLQSAVEKIFEHATEQRRIERFGILVGGVFSDPQSGDNWIEVVDMLPAERVRANVASVEVSNEEISYLNTKVDKILEETNKTVRKIGWYHTHPGHGIFLSSTDQTNQRLCYTADWQIALVVDPQQLHYGVFSGPECRALFDGILVISSEEAERLSTPAFQSWKHVAPSVPTVIRPTRELVISPPSADAPPIINQPQGGRPHIPVTRDLLRLAHVMDKGRRILTRHKIFLGSISLIALLIIALLLAINLVQSNNELQQANSQLPQMQKALDDQKKQEDAYKKLIQKTQTDLLDQANALRDNLPLAYRRLLRSIVKLDPQSDNGKKATTQLNAPISYTVAANDTFDQLAIDFNVTVDAIKDVNPGVDPTHLRAGQKIIIPGEKVTG